MKILFLSRWFPYPPSNGSKLRIYNLLRALKSNHEVTLLSFSDQTQSESEALEVLSICSDLHIVPWREYNPKSVRARLGFLSLKPRSIVDTFSPEMAEKISTLLKDRRYDLVIASQLSMAAYYPYFKNTPSIFEELEIGLTLPDMYPQMGYKDYLRRKITWVKLRHYLAKLFNFFQAITVVSDKEAEQVSQYFPGRQKVVVIPNCLNVDDYKKVHVKPIPGRLIFTGSFRYPVNYEAMQWFVGRVFPLILQKIPSAHLIITGDHADLPLPSNQQITLAGHVDDVRPLLASSMVAVAPLWSGGGTRLKILESLALGIPVVSTSKGAEGLEVVHGKNVLLADDPLGFAESAVRILEDPGLRDRLSEEGGRLVREKYSFEVMSKSFEVLLQSFNSL